MNTKRIVLTGPESTGKSAITAYLAERLRLPHAKEYARTYLERYGSSYNYDLLLELSRHHKLYQEDHIAESAPLGILDTDMINYKIWCEVAFGRCHPEIISAMEAEVTHVLIVLSGYSMELRSAA